MSNLMGMWNTFHLGNLEWKFHFHLGSLCGMRCFKSNTMNQNQNCYNHSNVMSINNTSVLEHKFTAHFFSTSFLERF